MTDELYIDYGTAILMGYEYLLEKYPDVFVIGQGLWSPWYVGNTMKNLDKKFGKGRIIDTPVSELACTGAAVGASLAGMRPIVVHPRMDFMLYAMDPIVNQAAKWSSMFGAQAHPSVTIRSIINRGGEQGAQHSQALHAWFAHVPGLRVVMPATVSDARDLLISSVLCDDPVLYIDDRWLYDQKSKLEPIKELKLSEQEPNCLKEGKDLTIVASGFSTKLACEVSKLLSRQEISAEIIDIRILNPIKPLKIIQSVKKTRRLVVVDGGFKTCGFASEIISLVTESIELGTLISKPLRITLPDAPAPTSSILENNYYINENQILDKILEFFK